MANTKPVAVLGIDPGISGGIALITEKHAVAYKMPDTPADIFELLQEGCAKASHVFLERVHSMPKQGVSSTFKFGMNYGFLQGCITALKIPHTLVTPMVWQKVMYCRTGGDKNVTKIKAQQLYPELKITHATADALLIATYGFHVLYGLQRSVVQTNWIQRSVTDYPL